MFYYIIYGKTVASSVNMPLLNEIDKPFNVDLQIHVEYKTITDENIGIIEHDDHFEINLIHLAKYCVFPERQLITCVAKDFEAFFSTLFNIPFSVYFLCKDSLLYHACSLLHNGQIFCITGNKGAGKSTITELLGNMDDFAIFGDDTICIDRNSYGYSAHQLIKQTPETVSHLNLNTLEEKNAAGKSYIKFENHIPFAKINAVFHVSRSNEPEFKVQRVTNSLTLNSVFKANLVGVSHMPHSLIVKSLDLKAPLDLTFYRLIVPNDLKCLIEHKENLKTLLLNELTSGERNGKFT
ncbi:MAG: hypothetical protein E7525_00575 [Ruminococcaceae bacterium]|nr:hypothetical protein [Oscillospiraceae bacterium]